jgi:hypothetical protein
MSPDPFMNEAFHQNDFVQQSPISMLKKTGFTTVAVTTVFDNLLKEQAPLLHFRDFTCSGPVGKLTAADK